MNNGNPDEARLLARLRALPRERVPAVDLWPGIQARLNPVRRRSPWWSQAVAAALVAALGLSVVWIGGERERPAGSGSLWPVAWQVSVAGAELEYSGALRDLRERGLPGADGAAAVARDEFVTSLQLVDRASQQVRAAIARDPEAGYLTAMLVNLQRKRLGVLRDLALSAQEDDAAEETDRRA